MAYIVMAKQKIYGGGLYSYGLYSYGKTEDLWSRRRHHCITLDSTHVRSIDEAWDCNDDQVRYKEPAFASMCSSRRKRKTMCRTKASRKSNYPLKDQIEKACRQLETDLAEPAKLNFWKLSKLNASTVNHYHNWSLLLLLLLIMTTIITITITTTTTIIIKLNSSTIERVGPRTIR